MTSLETTTLILGIIGTVTGSIALIFQIISEIRNFASLKITSDKLSYYVEPKTGTTGPFKTKCYALINLKISNTSSLPITIDEISIKDSVEHNNEFMTVPPSIELEDGTFTYINNNKGIPLPKRIPEYDSIYVCLKFPFFEQHKGKKTKIKFVTPRKNYYFDIKLKEVHDEYFLKYPNRKPSQSD